jgi:glutamyl-Q tRNA(Asp) synthetase
MSNPSTVNTETEKVVNTNYIGRFAPSPTGPLHFGSLLAALASFLDARANHGLWLVRIEDLDPPREPEGSADLILQQLNDLELHWDGQVIYQSSRLEAYQSLLQQLQERKLCFPCDCTRPQIKAMGKAYDGSCRHRQTAPAGACAIRVRTESTEIAFEDLIQGHYQQNVNKEVGDFVVRRKDNLFAYQLAVVADDEWQNITHCVRGFDLIDSTPRQIYLQKLLNYSTPSYAHIPIITDALGQKLSKQAFAPSINTNSSAQLIFQALTVLGQAPPTELKLESPQQQLRWAIGNWDIRRVPKLANIKQESPP